jgi:hypothetical protein
MSTDGNYNGRDPADVTVSNTDNDSAGITVSAISGKTNEGGGQATFTVVLNSQPTADVVLHFDSNDKTEGLVDKTSLTFTAMNWNGTQTVTVTGVNDDLADGEQPYAIVFHRDDERRRCLCGHHAQQHQRPQHRQRQRRHYRQRDQRQDDRGRRTGDVHRRSQFATHRRRHGALQTPTTPAKAPSTGRASPSRRRTGTGRNRCA